MSELYVARHPAAAWRRLEDEVIVMAAQESWLFTLNEVAAEIWEAADGRTPLASIVRDRICEKFEVDFEEAYRDAEELLRALAERGIVLLSETPLEAGTP
jgi:hypothetical protein